MECHRRMLSPPSGWLETYEGNLKRSSSTLQPCALFHAWCASAISGCALCNLGAVFPSQGICVTFYEALVWAWCWWCWNLCWWCATGRAVTAACSYSNWGDVLDPQEGKTTEVMFACSFLVCSAGFNRSFVVKTNILSKICNIWQLVQCLVYSANFVAIAAHDCVCWLLPGARIWAREWSVVHALDDGARRK